MEEGVGMRDCVPGGSELGGDDMCSVCMDHVS